MQVGKARAAMETARANAAPAFLDDTAVRLAAARPAIDDLVDQLDQVVGCLADLNTFASRHGLPMARLIDAAPALKQRVADLRLMVRGG